MLRSWSPRDCDCENYVPTYRMHTLTKTLTKCIGVSDRCPACVPPPQGTTPPMPGKRKRLETDNYYDVLPSPGPGRDGGVESDFVRAKPTPGAVGPFRFFLRACASLKLASIPEFDFHKKQGLPPALGGGTHYPTRARVLSSLTFPHTGFRARKNGTRLGPLPTGSVLRRVMAFGDGGFARLEEGVGHEIGVVCVSHPPSPISKWSVRGCSVATPPACDEVGGGFRDWEKAGALDPS